MTNVLGLSLEEARKALGTDEIQVEILEGRRPRVSAEATTQNETAPREASRGTLRVVRQKGNVLSVCRFNDNARENNDENIH